MNLRQINKWFHNHRHRIRKRLGNTHFDLSSYKEIEKPSRGESSRVSNISEERPVGETNEESMVVVEHYYDASIEIKREPKTEIKEEHSSDMTFQTGLQDDDEFYHECLPWSAN